jgi:hypothetical protein
MAVCAYHGLGALTLYRPEFGALSAAAWVVSRPAAGTPATGADFSLDTPHIGIAPCASALARLGAGQAVCNAIGTEPLRIGEHLPVGPAAGPGVPPRTSESW